MTPIKWGVEKHVCWCLRHQSPWTTQHPLPHLVKWSEYRPGLASQTHTRQRRHCKTTTLITSHKSTIQLSNGGTKNVNDVKRFNGNMFAAIVIVAGTACGLAAVGHDNQTQQVLNQQSCQLAPSTAITEQSTRQRA